MARISKVLAVPATGAFCFEDLSAYQADTAAVDGITRGVAAAVSMGLVLDDGQVAWGDCVAAAHSGRAGRPGAFRSAEGLTTIQRVVVPALAGRTLTSFRELATEVDMLVESVQEARPVSADPERVQPEPQTGGGVEDQSRRALLAAAVRLLSPFPWEEQEDQARSETPQKEKVATELATVERQIHPAVRYGVSQALLKAVALSRGITMAEVVADEWGLPRPDAPVPVHAVSGDERYLNADKMIVRRVASLPDAAVNNIPEQVGDEGFELSRYVRWLVGRIQELGGEDYQPTIHLNINGALGQIFDNNLGRVLGQLYSIEYAAQQFPLRVENPLILDSREGQIEALKKLRRYIRFRRMKVQLVADEWVNSLDDIQAFLDAEAVDMIHVKMPDLGSLHNSVEAVLACQANDVAALLGGSPTETDLSARAAVHVALATRPDVLMARPGRGVDEAVSLVQNEMARSLAQIRARDE